MVILSYYLPSNDSVSVKLYCYCCYITSFNGYTDDDLQNYPFCKIQLLVETFGTQLNEPTNTNSIKVPKIVNPMHKQTLNLKTLGTEVLNRTMSQPSLAIYCHIAGISQLKVF